MAYVAEKFVVSEEDRATLASWVRARTMPQEWVLRAKIVLGSAEGEGPRPMARGLGVLPNTVCIWRRRQSCTGLPAISRCDAAVCQYRCGLVPS